MSIIRVGTRSQPLVAPEAFTNKPGSGTLNTTGGPPTPAAPTVDSLAVGIEIEHTLTEPASTWDGLTATDKGTAKAGNVFWDGQRVLVSNLTGGSGITDPGNYYIVGSTGGVNFQLAEELDGDPIDFGSDVTAGTWRRYLPPEVTHLNVYASTASGFTPAQATQVGQMANKLPESINAVDPNEGNATLRISPATGKYYYTKVIAVDQDGRKSSASAASGTARGVLNDLTVTDTITLDGSGKLITGPSGQRIEITASGSDRMNFYTANASDTEGYVGFLHTSNDSFYVVGPTYTQITKPAALYWPDATDSRGLILGYLTYSGGDASTVTNSLGLKEYDVSNLTGLYVSAGNHNYPSIQASGDDDTGVNIDSSLVELMVGARAAVEANGNDVFIRTASGGAFQLSDPTTIRFQLYSTGDIRFSRDNGNQSLRFIDSADHWKFTDDLAIIKTGSTDVDVQCTDVGSGVYEIFAVSSTIRHKRNVTRMSEDWTEVVARMPDPVTFEHIDRPGKVRAGLIAESMHPVWPWAVPLDDDDHPFSINYSSLTVPLLGAMKDLIRRVEALEARAA